MHPETLSGLFVRQARRAGLPPIRLHDLGALGRLDPVGSGCPSEGSQ
jgi:hypothetical protein